MLLPTAATYACEAAALLSALHKTHTSKGLVNKLVDVSFTPIWDTNAAPKLRTACCCVLLSGSCCTIRPASVPSAAAGLFLLLRPAACCQLLLAAAELLYLRGYYLLL